MAFSGSPPGERVGSGGAPWRRLLVEAPRPEGIRRHRHAKTFAVLAVCIGAFMGQLDASIVNLAYPALRADFHAGIAAVQWVGLSYLLVLVATLTAVGRLSDMLGNKLLYVYGFVVFGVGSALCALAPSLIVLDLFRGFQAIGAAMMQANSVAIIANTIPRERLGRAIGLQGAAQAVGLGLGPAVGGLLVAAGGWRLVFLVNVPAAILGVGCAWFLIPRSIAPAARTRFDWQGVAWFAPGIAALLLTLSLASNENTPLAVPVGLGVATLLCANRFLASERRSTDPLIDVELFAGRSFRVGIGTALVSYVVMFGVLFVVPFTLEHGLGQRPATAGLELTVFPLALGLVAPLSGIVTDRRGPRLPTTLGLVIAAFALTALAVDHGGVGVIVADLALLGVGLGACIPANNADVMAAAPRSRSGVASGILNTTRGLGTALGVAIAGLVLSLEGGSGTAGIAGATGVAMATLAAIAGVGALVAFLRLSEFSHRSH